MSSSPGSELALLLNDDGSLKLGTTVAAMVVRSAMEAFHAERLTDEHMAALDPIIRDAVCTALHAIHHGEEEPWCRRFFEHHLKMVPPYREAPELLAGAKRMRAREQGEREAEFGRRRRRSTETE